MSLPFPIPTHIDIYICICVTIKILGIKNALIQSFHINKYVFFNV